MQSALRDIHAERLLILDFGSQYTNSSLAECANAGSTVKYTLRYHRC